MTPIMFTVTVDSSRMKEEEENGLLVPSVPVLMDIVDIFFVGMILVKKKSWFLEKYILPVVVLYGKSVPASIF